MKYTFLPCTVKSSWQHCPFPRANTLSTLRLSHHPLTSKAHRGMCPLQVLLCAWAVCSARSPGPWGTSITQLPHGQTNQEPRVVPDQAAHSPVGPSMQQQSQRSQVHLGMLSISTRSIREAEAWRQATAGIAPRHIQKARLERGIPTAQLRQKPNLTSSLNLNRGHGQRVGMDLPGEAAQGR